MAALKFDIDVYYSDGLGFTKGIEVLVRNPVGETPEVRIAGGLWTAMGSQSSSGTSVVVKVALPPSGWNLIEYRDDNGQRTLCDYYVIPDTLLAKRPHVLSLAVLAIGESIHLMGATPIKDSNGTLITALPICWSLDKFVSSSKCGTSSDPNSSDAFPPPFEAPGDFSSAGTTLPSISYKLTDGEIIDIARDVLISGDIQVLDPYFEVPKTQSITFIQHIEPDNSNTFQTLDNVLFEHQKHPNYKNGMCYSQRFNQAEAFNVQFRSNLANHECKLYKIDDDSEVSTYIPELKVQNVGKTETFDVRLQNHGNSQTRVYFIGESSIPLPVKINDPFEILNNADGFNGIYNVIAIQTDTVIGQQYLVINKNYVIESSSSLAQARFTQNVLSFDIYEFPASFLIDPDYYYIKIRAYNPDVEYIAYSEPIHIKQNHKNTNLISFTNADNAFDIDYQSSITHFVRVESSLFKRIPTSVRNTLRNTDGSMKLLSSKPQRKVIFEIFNIPPYMIEKIALAFEHDVKKINGIEVVSEEGLEEPEYRDRYGRADVRVTVEQKQWFGTYNGDDLGGVDVEQGFVIANESYIKR